MCVNIKINPHGMTATVNGKKVYVVKGGNWKAVSEELTTVEKEKFHQHLYSLKRMEFKHRMPVGFCDLIDNIKNTNS